MPMLNFIKLFVRDSKGTPSVEFALYLPILLLMFTGMTEVGYAVAQSVMLEKSLRSGALYAARSELPLSSATETSVKNIVRTGTTNGSGAYLIDGWSDSGATLDVSVNNYTLSSETSVLGSNQLPVITITASVPYSPILSSLLNTLGIGDITISLSHEQAHIGV